MSVDVEELPLLSRVAVISVRQPWLYAIMHLGKRRENRRRRMNYVGPIYLHASSGCSDEEYDDAVTFIRDRVGITEPIPPWQEMPLGTIVARTMVLGCTGKDEGQGDPWAFPDQHGILFGDVEPLPAPVPLEGRPWTPFYVPQDLLQRSGPEPLRVVLGDGEIGCAAYRAAVARGGRVFACAPEGDPLALLAGERNVTASGAGAALILYADEVVDVLPRLPRLAIA